VLLWNYKNEIVILNGELNKLNLDNKFVIPLRICENLSRTTNDGNENVVKFLNIEQI